jgi:hypothetical protein
MLHISSQYFAVRHSHDAQSELSKVPWWLRQAGCVRGGRASPVGTANGYLLKLQPL